MAGWVRVLVAVSVAGCSSDSSPAPHGTIAYVEAGTQNVRVLDLATNKSTLIDAGQFRAVSIAPDARHVSYSGEDGVVKFADRSGVVTELPDGGEGPQAGRWITNDVFVYSIDDATGRQGSMILSGLDTEARFVPDSGATVSADGTLDVYVNPRGDVILENIDGTNSHILVPTIDANAVNPRSYAGLFTPGQQSLIVTDRLDTGWITHVVSLVGAPTIDFAGLTPGGGGGVFAPTLLGASITSPDGTEMLMTSYTALVAATLATGEMHTLVTFEPRVYSAGAVFLDADHVLWVRAEDRSVSDVGDVHLSVHVVGPEGDIAIDDPSPNFTWPAIAVLSDHTIVVPSDVLFVAADGTTLLTNEQMIANIIGIAADGTSTVTLTQNGAVEWLDRSGATLDLASPYLGAASFTTTD